MGSSSATPGRRLARLLGIEAREGRAAAASFILVFILMTAYYILRPVRDAMAGDWSDARLSWLWTSTFFLSAAAVSLYGVAVARIRLRFLAPGVYGFFSLSFLAFFLGTRLPGNLAYLDQLFYVWLSVFSLFHVSVFWSLVAHAFSREQSQRLFGFIAAGAASGALAGPAVPVFLADALGVYNLILPAAGLLALAPPLALYLGKLRREGLGAAAAGFAAPGAIGGNPFAGFTDLLANRYLLGISLFILLYTAMSGFVYFELKNMLAGFDRATRSQYWGMMDLAVNALAIVAAMFATSRLVTRFGLAATLTFIPALLALGWLVLAFAPLLAALLALQIARRAGNYAITRPGREMLFTQVGRETRFKTKPVMDVVIYRGGDMLTGWLYTALAQGLGLGLAALSLVGAGIALLWAAVAFFLGNAYDRGIYLGAARRPGAAAPGQAAGRVVNLRENNPCE